MKRILALSLCLGLALTQVGQAKDNNNKNAKQHANKQAAVAQHNANVAHKQNVKVQRNVQAQRNVYAHQNVNVHHAKANYQANVNARNAAAVNAARARQANWQYNNAVVAKQNQKIAKQNNRIANQNYRAAAGANRIVTRNNVVISNPNSWYQARQYNWHTYHDRSWWNYNYPSTRFVIFGGGYYFWNNGYWYPAYGYDRAYSRYTFDEPIYGPNESDPGRVISDVQIRLQRDGYYHGPIDGLIGPMTRRALARYQADNGLYVTRAIDEPTLQALGLA